MDTCFKILFLNQLLEYGVEIYGTESKKCCPDFNFWFYQYPLRNQIFTINYLSEDQVKMKKMDFKTIQKDLEKLKKFAKSKERIIWYDRAVIEKISVAKIVSAARQSRRSLFLR